MPIPVTAEIAVAGTSLGAILEPGLESAMSA